MWLLAEVETSTALFLAGLVLMIGVFLLRSQRQVVRTSQAFPRPAALPADSEPLRGRGLQSPEGFARWEVEMHDLARELTAKLDTKITLLQQLLRAADEQGTRLTTVLERAKATESLNPHALAAVRPALDAHLAHPRPHALTGRHVATQAAALAAADHAQHRGVTFQPVEEQPPRPYEEIAALSDAGQSPDDISSLLGTPVGEVELIVNLRKQQLAANTRRQ
jgi:hypothetical protein